jgi:AraC family transcriptional regulator of arabinose operon
MRLETPHRTAMPMITGHFVEGPGYAAYRSRGTRDWLIIYTVAGKGRFGHAGGEMIATPGDLMLHAPESPHDYGVEASLKHWELLWAHFLPRPAWHELLHWPEAAKGLLHIRLPDEPARRRMRELFLELHQLNSGGLRRRQMFAMNQLERILLTADLCNPRSEQARIDPRIRLAVDHICANLSQPLRVDSLAALCHLSPSRFAHLFRQQVGQTPQQFVELQRLNRAKELLALTPRTIQTIAYDLGFENPFYFTLRFRKHTGMSPSEYRKEAVANR